MAQKKIKAAQTDGLLKGPASSTDNAIVRFDGTTGELVQESNLTIGDGFTSNGQTRTILSTASDNQALMIQANNTGSTLTSYLVLGDTLDANSTNFVLYSDHDGTIESDDTLWLGGSNGVTIYSSSGFSDVTINTERYLYLYTDNGIKWTGTKVFLDTNNLTMFSLSNVASAVNYLTAGNSITAAAPTITATGTDTNISINMVPKGTGRLQSGGVTVPTISSTDTLTNKRIQGRVYNTTSTTSLSPDIASYDTYNIFALAGNLTINNPSVGTSGSEKMLFRIKDDGTSRTLTWGADYRAIGVTLPTTTVANKLMYIGMIYHATDSKWDVIAVSQEA